MTSIRFPCPGCGAKIKAPLGLIGRERNCPGCAHVFVVPAPVLEDCGPILVPIEEDPYYRLAVSFRRDDRPTRRPRLEPARAG